MKRTILIGKISTRIFCDVINENHQISRGGWRCGRCKDGGFWDDLSSRKPSMSFPRSLSSRRRGAGIHLASMVCGIRRHWMPAEVYPCAGRGGHDKALVHPHYRRSAETISSELRTNFCTCLVSEHNKATYIKVSSNNFKILRYSSVQELGSLNPCPSKG